MKSSLCSLLLVFAFCGVRAYGENSKRLEAETPDISITNVPPASNGGEYPVFPIAGKVSGVSGTDLANYKVVLYAHASNGVYYVQPTVANPFTRINRNATWSAITHGGLEYIALLVRPSFKPPAMATSLPEPSSGTDIVARVDVPGK